MFIATLNVASDPLALPRIDAETVNIQKRPMGDGLVVCRPILEVGGICRPRTRSGLQGIILFVLYFVFPFEMYRTRSSRT